MKREQCERHIGEIQRFMQRLGVDANLMRFELHEAMQRVFFVVYANSYLTHAGFVACHQDVRRMQDVVSSHLRNGESVYVYDAPASSAKDRFYITPGLFEQFYYRIFHVIMHEIVNTHLKKMGFGVAKNSPEYREIDAIMEGITEWLVSQMLVMFFEETYPQLMSDLETYISLTILNRYDMEDKLYKAMRVGDVDGILCLQQYYWRNYLFFMKTIQTGLLKKSRFGTDISGAQDISPAYVFLCSRYATSFRAVQRVVQKQNLDPMSVLQSPELYKDALLAELR